MLDNFQGNLRTDPLFEKYTMLKANKILEITSAYPKSHT